jgi:hypothetical protein
VPAQQALSPSPLLCAQVVTTRCRLEGNRVQPRVPWADTVNVCRAPATPCSRPCHAEREVAFSSLPTTYAPVSDLR